MPGMEPPDFLRRFDLVINRFYGPIAVLDFNEPNPPETAGKTGNRTGRHRNGENVRLCCTYFPGFLSGCRARLARATHAPSSPIGAEKPGLLAKFARSNASLARLTPLPFAAPSAILSSRAAKLVLLGLLL